MMAVMIPMPSQESQVYLQCMVVVICIMLYCCCIVFIVRVYEEPGPVGDGGLAVEEPVGMEVHCVREVNNLSMNLKLLVL